MRNYGSHERERGHVWIDSGNRASCSRSCQIIADGIENRAQVLSVNFVAAGKLQRRDIKQPHQLRPPANEFHYEIKEFGQDFSRLMIAVECALQLAAELNA